MSAHWFETLRECVHKASGVCIDEDKQYLARTRLTPLLDVLEAQDVPALVRRAASLREPLVTQRVVEAMMTGETSFFRDQPYFDYLATTILPDVIARLGGERRLRIWCAACSSGQEAYSVAMTLEAANFDLRAERADILATDLSSVAIEKAAAGLYNQFEVQRGLPVNMLLRHFTSDQGRWRISQQLRNRLRFATINLVDRHEAEAPFDIIFCRNVLMYFDQNARRLALDNLDAVLAPGGWLILGSTETSIVRNPAYASERSTPGIYQKSLGGHAREAFELPQSIVDVQSVR